MGQLEGKKYIVTEFLTKNRFKIFLAARDMVSEGNVWTLDGRVYLRLLNGKKMILVTTKDLAKVLGDHINGDEVAAGKSQMGFASTLLKNKKTYNLRPNLRSGIKQI